MPVKQKFRSRRRSTEQLTIGIRHELLHGKSLIHSFEDEGVLRRAWELHQDEICREFRERHPLDRCPGYVRPFGEWLFEIVPDYGERRVVASRFKQEHRPGWVRHGILHTHTIPPIQETEVEFLRRHDLLNAEEKRFFAYR